MAAPDTNQAQIEYWNQQSGPKWVAQQGELDRLLASLGLAAMERLSPLAGASVIDVGCGCGDTTLALADRTGPSGAVLGVDISGPMLARARERAAGRPNVTFLQADAQTHRFEPASADALFSRFGVMFFADPAAAFANLRSALRPGGSVSFVCWQRLDRNPWCLVPLGAMAPHVQLPPPPAPGEPGPFAFGDPDRVRGILEGAGFATVRLETLEQPLRIGTGGLDEAVTFTLDAGPAARFLKDVAADVKARVRDAVGAALAPYAGPHGVSLDGACWIVTARNPA
jgi:SAM-dependent methyltransferase